MSEYTGFYYLNYAFQHRIAPKEPRPIVVTVCILLNDQGYFSRGLSIKSPKDFLNRKIGRKHALAAARKANGMGCQCLLVKSYNACTQLQAIYQYSLIEQHKHSFGGFFKGQFNVHAASDFELKIFNRLLKTKMTHEEQEANSIYTIPPRNQRNQKTEVT